MSCCRKKERPTLVKLFCDSFEQYSQEAAQADLQLETTNPYPRHKLKMGRGLSSVSFSAYCPEKFAQLQQLTGLLLPVRLLPTLPCSVAELLAQGAFAQADACEELRSPGGKSGALLFLSPDRRFICKTVPEEVSKSASL